MAKKNKNLPKRVEVGVTNGTRTESTVLRDGSRSLKQLIAPSSIQYTSEHEIKIENNYARSFVVNGYPASVHIGWLDGMYYYPGDMDVAVFVEPSDMRNALDELTDKITQYTAQYDMELEKGSVRHITELRAKIDALMNERSMLEQNYENMFHVSTFCTMYNDNLQTLNKEAQKFQSRLSSSRMSVMPLFLRQDDGYKTCSPYMLPQIGDYYRNMNTSALSAMFPFYKSEVNHPNGTLVGVNRLLSTPVIIDFFNRKVLGNANMCILATSGSGKSYFASLFIMRSSLEGVRHVIIDPENEYGRCTDAIGGVTVRIAPGSGNMINPFDIDKEIELDADGNPTGREFVDIKGKTAELLNLFSVMIPDKISSDIKSDLAEAVMQLYWDFGINEDPRSLYEETNYFDEETGKYYTGMGLKVMPRLSNFIAVLEEKAEREKNDELTKVIKSFRLYTEGNSGVYDLFDCYTTINSEMMNSATVVRFDVSGIEDDMLRPVGMYIALSWVENKFIKKDLKTKKRIVCDEAWVMLHKKMAGNAYTALFLEKCSRRIRKYNGSLCTVSQNFKEFISRPEGESVLSSSAVKVFLRQSEEDMKAVSSKFLLSEGEIDFLLSATIGEALIKVGTNSFVADIVAFPFEDALISKKYLKETEN